MYSWDTLSGDIPQPAIVVDNGVQYSEPIAVTS